MPKDYAILLASGFDAMVRAHDLAFREGTVEALQIAKDRAAELGDGGEGVSVTFGGETLQVAPHGAHGCRWFLTNDDFSIKVASPTRPWPVVSEMRSAGLWEHGFNALAKRIDRVLGDLFEPAPSGKPDTVARFDWCWDFYSPAFTAEMTPAILGQLVAHASTRTRGQGEAGVSFWGKGDRLYTVTVGSKAGLQVQVYDKGREIREASGKTWLVDLWERVAGDAGYHPPNSHKIEHVWRIEARFGADFLKARRVRSIERLDAELPSLLAEALMTRRLCSPMPSDTNRRRWPLHPLWQMAVAVEDMPLLGRTVVGRRVELQRRMVKQLAGLMRSAAVLADGDVSDAAVAELVTASRDHMARDPDGARKAARARERYRFVDEAK